MPTTTMPDATAAAPRWSAAPKRVRALTRGKVAAALRLVMDKGVVLALMLPALLLIGGFAALIRRHSPGPVFYREERVGRGGRTFTILKLRTMHGDADARLRSLLAASTEAREEWTVYHKLTRDPRIAGPVARLARQTSIDELPQLLAVLRGDMHLVGPRPVEPGVRPYFPPAVWDERMRCRPGITGLWQLYGRPYGMRTMPRWDRLYLRRRSLALDLLIVWRTPFRMFAARARA